MFADIAKPIAPYLERDDVYDFCINSPGEVFYSTPSGWRHHANELITQEWCERLVTAISNAAVQKTDKTSPLLSTELVTGERIQIVVPGAVNHVSVTIRRPNRSYLTLDHYQERGLLRTDRVTSNAGNSNVETAKRLYDEGKVYECLAHCVDTRLNIMFSGSTGSGKTTIANTIGALIPERERIITIEDAAEMRLTQPNQVNLFYPRNEKNPAVTADDLLASCLRMAPDRIIFGELRGAEAFFYVDQINTGHAGSITTIHANTAEKALKRLVKLIKRSVEGQGFHNDEILDDVRDEVHVIFQWHQHGLDHAYFPPLEATTDVRGPRLVA
ncbi:MAG: P-type DNA transfer ATPase VirB11 [Parahaliea sp.]